MFVCCHVGLVKLVLVLPYMLHLRPSEGPLMQPLHAVLMYDQCLQSLLHAGCW